MPTLDGNDISIERVPSPYKTILVKDLPVSATYDSVLATFEDEQDGGGEVERIQLELEKGTAFVKFNDPSGTMYGYIHSLSKIAVACLQFAIFPSFLAFFTFYVKERVLFRYVHA